MYIASLCFSKVSVLVFVKAIIKSASDKRTLWIVIGAISAWAISSEFATAFQCHVPRPWDYISGKCFKRVRRHDMKLLLYTDFSRSRGGTILEYQT